MIRDKRFLVYNASAGSGKTFRIAGNFLEKILESNSRFFISRLIGLTFTNDAANEMKSRILKHLMEASRGKLTPLVKEAIKNIQPKIEKQINKTLNEEEFHEEIIKRSQNRLKEILHRYDDFNLMTIDKLSYRIIRTFAREMDIPYDINVIMDPKEIIDNLIDEIISEVLPGDILMKSLISFAKENAENEQHWDIKPGLMEIVNIIFDENHNKEVAQIKTKSLFDFISLKKILLDKRKEIIQQFSDFYKKAKNITNGYENLLDRSVAPIIRNLASTSTLKNIKFSPTLLAKISGEKKAVFYTKSKLTNLTPTEQNFVKNTLNENIHLFISELHDYYSINYPELILTNGFLKEINSLVIMNVLMRKISDFKELTHSIFINDFNFLIQEQLLRELSSDTPYIFMRLGEKYIHYFLDEFQDTSELQWKNMIPLIKESLSKDFAVNFSSETLGETMVVGDAKQSIYRFRNGKPEIFIDLSNSDLQSPNGNPFAHITGKKIKQMEYNWRSYGNIINFNNEFFSLNKKFLYHQDYQKVYDHVRQKLPEALKSERENKGYIQIQFTEKLSGTHEEGNALPELVYQIIEDAQKRGYDYNDICFLYGKHDSSIPVAEYLNQKNIPIISKRSLLVQKSGRVRFIVNMMKYLSFGTTANLFDALHFLIDNSNKKIDSELLVKLSQIQNSSEVLNKFIDLGYNINPDLLTSLPPYDLAVYLLEKFNLNDFNEQAYIQVFLDEIHEYTTQNKTGLPGFLSHWEEIKDQLSLQAADTTSAVRFMTVHASKGLEFPIVIYLGNQSLLNKKDKDQITWVSVDPVHFAGFETLPIPIRALEKSMKYQSTFEDAIEEKKFDNFNRLYVAHTRASKELYILTKIPPKNEKEHPDFAQLYAKYLKDNQWITGEIEENVSYSIGQKTFKEKNTSTKNQNINIENYLNFWGDKNRLKIRSKNYEYWSESKKNAIQYGLEIHEILSRITTKTQWQEQQTKLLANIPPKQKPILINLIEKILNHPLLSEYFTDKYKILNERALLIPSENIFHIKRPDKILIQGIQSIILDYKTGEKHAKHIRQINNYAEILETSGYEIQKKYLVYINHDIQVVQVD